MGRPLKFLITPWTPSSEYPQAPRTECTSTVSSAQASRGVGATRLTETGGGLEIRCKGPLGAESVESRPGEQPAGDNGLFGLCRGVVCSSDDDGA